MAYFIYVPYSTCPFAIEGVGTDADLRLKRHSKNSEQPYERHVEMNLQ
jgi:hypothetical protein